MHFNCISMECGKSAQQINVLKYMQMDWFNMAWKQHQLASAVFILNAKVSESWEPDLINLVEMMSDINDTTLTDYDLRFLVIYNYASG